MVHGCLVHHSSGHGIAFDGTVVGSFQNTVSECKVYNCGYIGISQYKAVANRIINNHIYYNDLEGVTIDVYSHKCIVSNNYIDNNCVVGGVGGIGIDASDESIITGNHIDYTKNGLPGIRTQNNIGSSQRNIISNNTIRGNSGGGIDLFNGTAELVYAGAAGNIVTGNVCVDNSEFGIRISSIECTHNLVSTNMLHSNTVNLINNGNVTDNVTNIVTNNITI
jgi:parallel beta-helix repeat protein